MRKIIGEDEQKISEYLDWYSCAKPNIAKIEQIINDEINNSKS